MLEEDFGARRAQPALACHGHHQLVESEASCELYGLLKRPDEKFVTERAYDNPKFVEDMVRDVAARLNAEPRVDAYVVESENFESIHNHSAYALIENSKR
jgi:GTP cyclohydrolase I